MAEQKIPNLERWWRHRRRHSYIAITMLVVMGTASFIVDITNAQAEVLSAIAYACTLIVIAYVTMSTWNDISAKVKK